MSLSRARRTRATLAATFTGVVVRRLALAATSAILGVAGLTVAAPPAHAATQGDLLISSGGSLYTQAHLIFQGMVPGVTRAVSIKVVNTDTVVRQYQVNVQASFNNHPVALYLGSKKVPIPYFTAPLDPGRSVTLSLRSTLPVGAVPAADYFDAVNLLDPVTATGLDNATVEDEPSIPGTTRNGLFLKTGTQPFVGGSTGFFDSEAETAAALKVGQTATFTLRLQNDGTTAVDEVDLYRGAQQGCPSDYTVTIKQGTKDITAAVGDGVYSSGPLAPGRHVDYKVLVKRINTTSCLAAAFYFTASGPDGTSSQGAELVPAA